MREPALPLCRLLKFACDQFEHPQLGEAGEEKISGAGDLQKALTVGSSVNPGRDVDL